MATSHHNNSSLFAVKGIPPGYTPSAMYRAVIVVVPLKYGYIPIPILPSTRVAVLIVDVVDVDKATTENSLVNEIGSTIEFQVLVDKLLLLPPWLFA